MPFECFLHLCVGPQGRAATLENAYEAKLMFTLHPSRAAEIITAVWATVGEWKVYFEHQSVLVDQIEKVASAFRHIDEVATQGLRRKLT